MKRDALEVPENKELQGILKILKKTHSLKKRSFADVLPKFYRKKRKHLKKTSFFTCFMSKSEKQIQPEFSEHQIEFD